MPVTQTSFLCRLFSLVVSLFINIYDFQNFNKNEGRGYDGHFTYGGRWKHLTYWNMRVLLGYFLLAVYADLSCGPRFTKRWCVKIRDTVFITVVFPQVFFVVFVFWIVYFADRELIHPQALDQFIPPSLNHCAHTAIMIPVLLEMLVRNRTHLPLSKALLCILAYYGAYLSFTLWVYSKTGTWPYGFFSVIPSIFIPVFFAFCYALFSLFYLLGEIISSHRSKEYLILSLFIMCSGIVYLDYTYWL